MGLSAACRRPAWHSNECLGLATAASSNLRSSFLARAAAKSEPDADVLREGTPKDNDCRTWFFGCHSSRLFHDLISIHPHDTRTAITECSRFGAT